MNVEINLPPFLQPLAGDAGAVNVSGSTVAECLAALVQRHPGLESKIFDRKGGLLKGLNIFINGEVAFPEPLSRPVRDGDRLHVTYIVMGG